MKAFCPNCGGENEGMPGGRITCRTCTASFEVPRERATPSAPPVDATFLRPNPRPHEPPPPPSVVKPPPSLGGAPQSFPGPRPSSPPGPSAPFPTGYRGPPPTGFGGGGGLVSGNLNQLAVISLVLGVVCCIPFASIGAIVTGVMARNQIAASNGVQRGGEYALVGIVLGALSLVSTIISLAVNLLGHR